MSKEIKRLAKYEKGIKDLLGYIRWAIKNEFSTEDILANVAHDLREFEENLNKDWFSPRTSGYADKI